MDQALKYYKEAAEADYYGAKVWLSKYYEEVAFKDIMSSQYWIEKAISDIDTNEDQYIQAKNLITLALLDEDKKLYREGISMMQKLSDEGYEPAMRYMDLMNNEDDDVNESDQCIFEEDLLDLIDFEDEEEEV